MKTVKKSWLMIGSISALIVPVVTVISCNFNTLDTMVLKSVVFNYRDLKLNDNIKLAEIQINKSWIVTHQVDLFDNIIDDLQYYLISVKTTKIDQNINVKLSFHQWSGEIANGIWNKPNGWYEFEFFITGFNANNSYQTIV